MQIPETYNNCDKSTCLPRSSRSINVPSDNSKGYMYTSNQEMLSNVKSLSKEELYSAANDPRPQMIPRPEMIPKLDRK